MCLFEKACRLLHLIFASFPKSRAGARDVSCASSARRWDDALREARVELAHVRRGEAVRRGDVAPPRLSLQGFRSLATLLSQRVRADREEEVRGIYHGDTFWHSIRSSSW